MSKHQVFIGDDAITEKAKQAQDKCNVLLHTAERARLDFRKCWLLKFKRTHRFKAYRSLGERVKVDEKG